MASTIVLASRPADVCGERESTGREAAGEPRWTRHLVAARPTPRTGHAIEIAGVIAHEHVADTLLLEGFDQPGDRLLARHWSATGVNTPRSSRSRRTCNCRQNSASTSASGKRSSRRFGVFLRNPIRRFSLYVHSGFVRTQVSWMSRRNGRLARGMGWSSSALITDAPLHLELSESGPAVTGLGGGSRRVSAMRSSKTGSAPPRRPRSATSRARPAGRVSRRRPATRSGRSA